jgi:predicted secreted Zn-dependent protease
MELRRSINQSRPWKDENATDARTEWKVQWSFGTMSVDGSYRLRSLETKTTITYTLPRWAPGAESSKALRDHWARYSAAIRTHEEGHARIALVAAGEMRRRINALPEAPTARSLEKQINDTADKVVAEYREIEAAYDSKTTHGASQGAHFP